MQYEKDGKKYTQDEYNAMDDNGKKGMVKCDAQKSLDISEDDLEKSLNELANLAGKDDIVSRKEFLLTKAQTETLEKSEQAELFQILGSTEAPAAAPLKDEIVKGFTENDDLKKALDVSDYLTENTAELVKALGKVSDELEKSDKRQHEFNLVLAKAVAQEGRVIQAISERLGTIESQPARGPKSQIAGQPLNKAFAGQPPPGDQLSKSEILDTLEEMNIASVDAGMGGATASGIDISTAASKYEQFNQISPKLLEEVKAKRSANVN